MRYVMTKNTSTAGLVLALVLSAAILSVLGQGKVRVEGTPPLKGLLADNFILLDRPAPAPQEPGVTDAYGGKVEEAVAGHSTALSVPDAKEAGVHRGMVCCEPGVFTSGDAVDVELALTPRAPRLSRGRHRRPPARPAGPG